MSANFPGVTGESIRGDKHSTDGANINPIVTIHLITIISIDIKHRNFIFPRVLPRIFLMSRSSTAGCAFHKMSMDPVSIHNDKIA